MDRIPYAVLDHKVLADDKPWSLHKSKGMLLSESYYRLNMMNKYDAVRYCGSMLRFMSCPHGHGKRLKWANFCKVRLCPMCSWRKSLLQARQLRQVAHVVASSHKCRWIFLTLTVKNVKSDDLPDEISHLTQSWKRLFERKQFKKTVLGFFRALEVTHNPDTGTYHPHFHALLCVTPSYFTRDYIKQSEWVELWQQSARLDYKPMVNVQAVKGRRDPEAEERLLKEKGIHLVIDDYGEHEFLPGKAVAEVAKYTVKAGDYIFPDDENRTDEVVLTLDKSLRQRKLYAFGGVMKDAWDYLEKAEKVTDVEDADLVHIDEDDNCKCSVCNSDMLEELYKWVPDRNQYIRSD